MSHVRKGYCAQCCGYLDVTYHHTDSPCVMTTEVLQQEAFLLENTLET
jgi:hypothetical protein